MARGSHRLGDRAHDDAAPAAGTAGTPEAAGAEDVRVSGAGKGRVWRWGFSITLASFLIGYTTAMVAGALLSMSDDLGLGTLQQGLVTSLLLLSAMVAALVTGSLAERFGRKRLLLASSVFFGVGLVVAAAAPGFALVAAGRIITGLGVGVASALVPTYLGELAPPALRGRLLTLNQLMQTVGMLVAYVVNLVFAASGDWRAMMWAGVVPAVGLLIAGLAVPDSPLWLVHNGRQDKADDVLDDIVEDPQARARLLQEYQTGQDEEDGGWKVVLTARVRPALLVGCALAALQQLTGVNTVLYFAPTIMQETGLETSNSIIYSVIIGVVNLVMTLVSLRLVDRFGRRPLLIASLAGMAVSVLALGLCFLLGLGSILMLVAMLVFVSSFAVGMGPVLWVILGEVFPSDVRAEGAGTGSAVNWSTNFLVSTAFLPLTTLLGAGWVFLLFAAMSVLGLLFVLRFVPETKGRGDDEIQSDLAGRFGRA